MKTPRCAIVRRRLGAYFDDELPVADRVSIANHLRACSRCGADVQALQAINSVLRSEARTRTGGMPDPAVLRDGIIGRLQAERAVSWAAQVGRLFEDLRLVWVVLSAGAAAAACVGLVAAIWASSLPEAPTALTGALPSLALPGSDRNPVALDQRMRLPRVNADIVLPDVMTTSEEDLVFALAAVVTREGRIAQPEVLVSNHDDRDVIRLMNAIQEARLQPASLRGTPVAVNVVWLFTHTTVRGKLHS